MNGIKFGLLFSPFFWELGQIRSNMWWLIFWIGRNVYIAQCAKVICCKSKHENTLQLQIRTVWLLSFFFFVNEGQCDPNFFFYVFLVSLKASFRKILMLQRKQHGVSSCNGVYVCIYSMYVHACTFTHSVAVIVIWSTVQRLYLFIVL